MTDYTQRRVTMVDTQVRPSDVTKFPILDAMLTVPRELFVPPAKREAAYAGAHIELGGGRVIGEVWAAPSGQRDGRLDALNRAAHAVVSSPALEHVFDALGEPQRERRER